jgi:hypothetical protein
VVSLSPIFFAADKALIRAAIIDEKKEEGDER